MAIAQELIDYLCNKKQYKRAIRESAQLIESLPNIGELHVKQAELFEKLRRADEARAGYFRAHDVFKQQGQLEKAAVQLERAG
jgi:Flp pilus assembly protein TadD